MNYSAKKNGEPAGATKHRRGIVLLVDDEPPLLAALERQFRLAGLFPLTCASIEAAKNLLDSWVVHVVIADERLPDGSGAQFLIGVGRQFPGVGRILLTAYMEPYLADLGVEHGFVALEKDARFAELLAIVNRELGDDA